MDFCPFGFSQLDFVHREFPTSIPMQNANSTSQLDFLQPTPHQPQKPLFVYLPGMDGSGLLLRSQIPYLEPWFEIRCLAIPTDDRSDWSALTQRVIDFVSQEQTINPQRAIYLCGESFGGCLAMQAFTTAPQLFTRVILINPASAFQLLPWLNWTSQYVNLIPDFIYNWTTVGFISILAALPRISQSDRDYLMSVICTIPPQTVFWRIFMLRKFAIPPEKLRRFYKPVLLVVSLCDRLLPSVEEAQRLQDLLPNVHLRTLPNSGHACLIERDTNLYNLIEQAGFAYNP